MLDKTALIIDSGLYSHMARTISHGYARTYYWSDWRGQFPTSKLASVGSGLGMERIEHWEDCIDKADIVIFLDIYHGPLQTFLKNRGHRVWGNGAAEKLELDRWLAKAYLKEQGSAVNKTFLIKGLHGKEGLIQHLKENEDIYVKGGQYRGDFESFHHENLWLSKPWLDELQNTLGPRQDIAEFVVESPIPGVECGFDGFSIAGVFPNVASYGYEAKDAGYVGKVYDKVTQPPVIREICETLSPFLKECDARGFLSIEFRQGKDKVPYIIDPCMRCGSPPSESYSELFSNWPEVIWAGAGGEVLDLLPTAKYVAQLVLRDEWAKENWLALSIPKGIEKYVKIHNHCRIDDTDYVVPNGIREIGGVIGLGDNLSDAIKQCLENAEEIKAYGLEYDKQAFSVCLDAVEEGIKFGIPW